MMSKLFAVLAICFSVQMLGCYVPASPAPSPAQVRLDDINKVRDAAKNVVANPRKWMHQATELAEYQTIASRLGIADDIAVVDFQRAATDMVAYGTQIAEIDERAFRAVQESTEAIEKRLRAGVSAGASAGGVPVPTRAHGKLKIDYQQDRDFANAEVAALAHQLYGSLNPEKAEEFRVKCQALADAYWKLLDCLAAYERELSL
ncbi:MAG: hypothetical protein K2Y05_04595 [Hyphomicrobiaceae bacterium]|nr:hypothetical protein [Hyphomicrobiaceae bacterium]